MAEPSISDQALATLDQALCESDPITRMMLIEQALKLHRRRLEARDAAAVEANLQGAALSRSQR